MALTPEEQKALDELTAKASEPDTDDDFEIEIFAGDKGARIPYRKGRSYLQEHFGIDLDPPAEDEGSNGDGNPGDSKGSTKAPARTTAKGQGNPGDQPSAEGFWTSRRGSKAS